MKSILLSIKPEWVAKILNGKKTIEVRKKFPADYVGWVYIYCTKGKPYLYRFNIDDKYSLCPCKSEKLAQQYEDFKFFNGKVVARFWCDKVEEIRFVCYEGIYDLSMQPQWQEQEYNTQSLDEYDLCEKSCLKPYELDNYLKEELGYAIHISQLEIFDKPKELCEFYRKIRVFEQEDKIIMCGQFIGVRVKKITKAPQNYCYIEGYKK